MLTTLDLVTIVICGVTTALNLIVLGLNVKLFTEFVKERLQSRRHGG